MNREESQPSVATISLGGLRFARLTERETLTIILDELERGRGGSIRTVNLDILRQCHEDEEVERLIARASLIVADGMSLIWASHLQGTPLPERVAGSSLIRTLSAEAAQRNVSVFLLGGNAGTAERAAATLKHESPGLIVRGTLCPPRGFERDPERLGEIDRAVLCARPDIVFVGLGVPKQDMVTERLRELLPGSWFIPCGISFSFLSGDIKRAPAWLQRYGLEWLHRLVQEPQRLFRRYLIFGLPFAVRIGLQAVAARYLRAA